MIVDFFRYFCRYFYQTVASRGPNVTRNSITTSVNRQGIPFGDLARYYPSERPGDYGEVVYRSQPQIAEQQRRSPPRVPSGTVLKPVAMKRHPVAFRTPRSVDRNWICYFLLEPSVVSVRLNQILNTKALFIWKIIFWR